MRKCDMLSHNGTMIFLISSTRQQHRKSFGVLKLHKEELQNVCFGKRERETHGFKAFKRDPDMAADTLHLPSNPPKQDFQTSTSHPQQHCTSF
jgi:hypothetical protein